MKEEKEVKKLRNKINALCIDYRFYRKKKKQTIIEPCLDEYKSRVEYGISKQEASNSVYNDCKLALEKKYEKRNRFLFLMLFSIALFLVVLIVESQAFDNLDYSINVVTYWQLVAALLFVGAIIFLALTHNGRFRTYLFLGICFAIYLFTFVEILYLTNISSSVTCFEKQRILFEDSQITIRTFSLNTSASGACLHNNYASSINDSGPYINIYGTLILSIVTIICYIVNHCIINYDYPRINVYNMCTQYGVTDRTNKNEIKQRALIKYYSLIDSGESRKTAKKDVMSELDQEFSATLKKKNRFMFSLVAVSIFFILSFGGSLICEYAMVDILGYVGIFALCIVLLFVTCIILVIMLPFYNHLYWYDYVIVSLIALILFVTIIAMGRLFAPGSDPVFHSETYTSYYPFGYVLDIDWFYNQVIDEEGVIHYVYSGSSSYFHAIWTNIFAILGMFIIIPVFTVYHFKLKREKSK